MDEQLVDVSIDFVLLRSLGNSFPWKLVAWKMSFFHGSTWNVPWKHMETSIEVYSKLKECGMPFYHGK